MISTKGSRVLSSLHLHNANSTRRVLGDNRALMPEGHLKVTDEDWGPDRELHAEFAEMRLHFKPISSCPQFPEGSPVLRPVCTPACLPPCPQSDPLQADYSIRSCHCSGSNASTAFHWVGGESILSSFLWSTFPDFAPTPFIFQILHPSPNQSE